LLHHICANWVNNDNVHQSLEVISSDKNIHSSLGMAREKVGNIPLNMSSTLQINSHDNIFKCIMGWCIFTPTPRHQSEWIPKSSTAWPHWHCERWIKTKGFKLESYDLPTNIVFHWLAWKKCWFKTSLISPKLLSSSIIIWTKTNVNFQGKSFGNNTKLGDKKLVRSKVVYKWWELIVWLLFWFRMISGSNL